MSTETRFEPQGTLPHPGAIGRIVRLAFGLWILGFFITLLRFGTELVAWEAPENVNWWVGILLGILLFPYVVNIGWSRSWGRAPQGAVIVIAGLLWLAGLGLSRATWTPALGAFLLAWMVYLYGHLGLSFVLSAVLGTPGCEMRALPHLWTAVTGHETAEHYCPGIMDNVDRWERRLRHKVE